VAREGCEDIRGEVGGCRKGGKEEEDRRWVGGYRIARRGEGGGIGRREG